MTSLNKGVVAVAASATAASIYNIPPGHHTHGIVTRPILPQSAFGEVYTAQAIPVYQTDFIYSVARPQLHRETEQAGGVVSYSNNFVVCSANTSALGLAAISSRRPLVYRPGQGAEIRFTALFDTPSTGSVQSAGLSNGETGLLVGYRFSETFSIWRQYGGAREVRTLTVSSGSTGAEVATITLEGVPVSVTLSNVGAGGTTRNAWEIAAADYGSVNDVGYDAFAEGSTVVFVRRQANTVSGSFAVSAATMTGSFTATVSGVAASNEVVLQPNFSVDPLDGTGPSGMVLDPTKGNVFAITYQYLGFGEIIFWVETDEDGQFIPFHEIHYANSNVIPSLSNPSITFSMSSYNFAGGASNSKTVKGASAAMFTQGTRTPPIPAFSALASKSGVAAARTPILSIKPDQVFGGRLMLSEAIMRAASMGVTSTKPVRVELVVNGTLNNTANFIPVGSESCMLADTSATSITGGNTKLAFTLGKDGNTLINLTAFGDIFLTRFDTISFVATPAAANTDIDASLSWFEEL